MDDGSGDGTRELLESWGARDSRVRVIESGAVDNSRKTVHPNKTVSGFVMGTQRLYDFIHDNPQVVQLDYPCQPLEAQDPQPGIVPSKVVFDRIYFAPEKPEQPSRGRKPSPQFLYDAREELGIDLTEVTERLERDGVAAFATAFDNLIQALEAKTAAVAAEWPRIMKTGSMRMEPKAMWVDESAHGTSRFSHSSAFGTMER